MLMSDQSKESNWKNSRVWGGNHQLPIVLLNCFQFEYGEPEIIAPLQGKSHSLNWCGIPIEWFEIPITWFEIPIIHGLKYRH